MISIHETTAIETLAREHRIDPQQLHLLRGHFLRRRRSWDESLSAVSPAARDVLASAIAPYSLELDQRYDSGQDGASRLVFRTGAGHRLESVLLRIASGRTSLCLSTQVGCAAKCSFCATGQMGMALNLSPAEILDQVVQAGQIAAHESRQLRNLIFMGMGEPFHNEDHLYAALEQLTAPRLFSFAPQRIVVSTVGLPGAMLRLADRFPDVRLALSLHSARQEVREQIIPLARRYPLSELRAAIERINARTSGRVMIEYLMFDSLTDTEDDVSALTAFLRGLRVHVNLIPFNPIDRSAHSSIPELVASSRDRIEEFASRLRQAGYPVTIRYSLGADVAAACGQLVQRRNREAALR